MKLYFLILISVVFLFNGCTKIKYIKPGATEEQMEQYRRLCKEEASRAVPYENPLATKLERDLYAIECLEKRGFISERKYEKLKKEGKTISKIDRLEASCFNHSTVACYEAGNYYLKMGGNYGLKKAKEFFDKGCDGYATSNSLAMRAKNLSCKQSYNLRKF